jgi:hypothetical protein
VLPSASSEKRSVHLPPKLHVGRPSARRRLSPAVRSATRPRPPPQHLPWHLRLLHPLPYVRPLQVTETSGAALLLVMLLLPGMLLVLLLVVLVLDWALLLVLGLEPALHQPSGRLSSPQSQEEHPLGVSVRPPKRQLLRRQPLQAGLHPLVPLHRRPLLPPLAHLPLLLHPHPLQHLFLLLHQKSLLRQKTKASKLSRRRHRRAYGVPPEAVVAVVCDLVTS